MRPGDFHEFLAIAVDAQADSARILGTLGLDVNVRCAALKGLDDELVGEAHDSGVRLVDLRRVVFLLVFDFALAFSELVDDLRQVGAVGGDFHRLAVRGGDVLQDVHLQPDDKVVTRSEIHGPDPVESRQILRIVHGDHEVLPGIRVYRVGGHTAGLQIVTVQTARGTVVLTSDASHFYHNVETRNPTQIITNLPEMLEGFETIHTLAGKEKLIVAGHDPLVADRFKPMSPGVIKIA